MQRQGEHSGKAASAPQRQMRQMGALESETARLRGTSMSTAEREDEEEDGEEGGDKSSAPPAALTASGAPGESLVVIICGGLDTEGSQ